MPLSKMSERDLALLESGQRDKPVEIQYRANTDPVDGSGAPDETSGWQVLEAIEWMARSEVSGYERAMSLQTAAPVDSLWSMLYRPDMDPDLVDVSKLRRLKYQNRIYNITFARTMHGNRGIQIATISRVG